MNLIISGLIDESLRNALIALLKPQATVRIHGCAYRLESVDTSSNTQSAVSALCNLAHVDHTYVPPGAKLKDYKLLAVDMDSTLITIECIDEMADFAGKKSEVAAITDAAMRGEIKDFEESLRRRVALLAGTSEDVMRRVFDERLELSPGAHHVVTSAKLAGLKVVLLSGGFDYFANRLKSDLELNFAYANALEILEGHLTGRILGPVIDASRKAHLLLEIARQTHCDPNEAIVVGDGANDIQMMEAVTFSVAYKAKPAVQKTATHSIKFGPLSTLVDWLPTA